MRRPPLRANVGVTLAVIAITAAAAALVMVIMAGPSVEPLTRNIVIAAAVAFAFGLLAIILLCVNVMRAVGGTPDPSASIIALSERIDQLSTSAAMLPGDETHDALQQAIASVYAETAAIHHQLADVQAALTVLYRSADLQALRDVPLAKEVAPPPPESASLHDTPAAAISTPAVPQYDLPSITDAQQQIENDMSIGQWDAALSLVDDLSNHHRMSAEAATLKARVHREYELYRESTVNRLYEQFKDELDHKQYRRAVSVARRLLDQFSDHKRVQKIRAQLPTMLENAEIEERQEDEARIQSLIRGKRFADAVELSESLIARFPMSPQAQSLDALLPRLRQFAMEQEASTAGHR